MNKRSLIALFTVSMLIFTFAVPLSNALAGKKANPMVKVHTNYGSFTIELYKDKAPITVQNFINYVENKFYDNTLIHRVEKGFVIQGGGYDLENNKKSPMQPIKNEADNGLKNMKYTLSMARTNEIHSATSQFFVNLQDNTALDHRGDSPAEFGYAVFGKVVDGTNIIDKIGMVKTKKEGVMHKPIKPVVVKSMTLVGKEKKEEKAE